MNETDIQNLIRIKLSEMGIISWRNHTFALKDKDGRMVRGGLCLGSSDIIAIQPVVITEAMVGQLFGRFVAVEVKKPGKRATSEQLNFIEAIRRHGGKAFVADSPEAIADLLE